MVQNRELVASIVSAEGDPLSSLLFCFSVLPEYLSTVESAPGVRAVAIVDDLELVGPHASVFDHLLSVSPKSGLVLGRPKCHLFWPRASPVPESLSAGCASRCLSLVKDGLPVLGLCFLVTQLFLAIGFSDACRSLIG